MRRWPQIEEWTLLLLIHMPIVIRRFGSPRRRGYIVLRATERIARRNHMAHHRMRRTLFPLNPQLPRRAFLRIAGALGGGLAFSACKKESESTTPQPAPVSASTPIPATPSTQREMAKFPEKTDLILLTDR